MAVFFHMGLPGPFSYSKRVGGKKNKRQAGPREWAISVVLILSGLAIWLMGWYSIPVLMLIGLVAHAGWKNRATFPHGPPR